MPGPVRIGVVFPHTEIGGDAAAIRDFAQAAEALGYSHILAFDHVLGAHPKTPGYEGRYTSRTPFTEPLVLFAYQQNQYIEAARATGCSTPRIIARYLLPNIVPELIILASIGIGAAIIAESSLSFLGFGVVPPESSWGYMLGIEGRRFQVVAPWLSIFPGAAIALCVFAFNMLGDALRDVLDPRLRA